LPDGTKRRIEWQPGGEVVMGEGPHVKIMDWNPGGGRVRPDGTNKGSWQTKEKYFIEGKENY